MTYEEFERTAASLFGLEPFEAAELAEEMVDAGYDPGRTGIASERFWSAAADTDVVAVAVAAEEEMYALDPAFPDDEYLDPDVEWEITAESEYSER